MTVPKTEEEMKKAGKTYEPVIYKGAGHGFMRPARLPMLIAQIRRPATRRGNG